MQELVLDTGVETILNDIEKTFNNDKKNDEDRRNLINSLARYFKDKALRGELKDKNGKKLEIYHICGLITNLIRERNIISIHKVTIWRYLDAEFKNFNKSHRKKESEEPKDITISGMDSMIATEIYNEVFGELEKIQKMSFDNLNKQDILNIQDHLKIIQNKTDMFVQYYNIKRSKTYQNIQNNIVNNNTNRKSIISTIKPPYQKNLLTGELKLLISDFSKLEKEFGKIRFCTQEEEYGYFEAVRALRLFLRPYVNNKYAKDLPGWALILKKSEDYNLGGLSKITLSEGQYYDSENDKILTLGQTKEIVKEEIRKNSQILPSIFMDMITDFPFLTKLSELFEKHIEPIRTTRRQIISHNMKNKNKESIEKLLSIE